MIDPVLDRDPAPDQTATREPVTPVTLSVVVPVSERAAPLRDIYLEYAAAIRAVEPDFEFVFVLDPGFRYQVAPLRELAEAGEPIRTLVAGQTLGETALLNIGVDRARADRILTLPPYYRIIADAIPGLLRRLDDGADLVIARRWPRRDSWVNRFQNRVFHHLLNRLAGGLIRDVACGVRVIRREVLAEIPLYGDFGRFFPILAARDGFVVVEMDAPQHPGDTNPRVYSPGVYVRRLLDVLGLFFLLRFTHKPLRFFGLMGGSVSMVGFAILLVLGVQRLQGQGIAGRPMLLLGVLAVVLGVQAIALGLIGEIIVHLNAPRRPPYRLARPE